MLLTLFCSLLLSSIKIRRVLRSCYKAIQGGCHTGNLYNAIRIPRLRECCRQVEAEVGSNSRNKIHKTWEQPYSAALYMFTALPDPPFSPTSNFLTGLQVAQVSMI